MQEYLKVIPYIETLGIESFRSFLIQPFKIDMLYPVTSETAVETLFSGWKGKDMVGYHKFTNEQKVVLEFFPLNYGIRKTIGKPDYLRTPLTINDFINDMYSFGIGLWWSEYIYKNFNPKEYMHRDMISDYYVNLLNKMEKGFELNL